MEYAKEVTEIEFNSMVLILKRLDAITYEINLARQQGDVVQMLQCLIDYYKEISPDLTPEENKVWEEIQKMKNFCSPVMYDNKRWVISQMDEIDIKLRKAAKVHGYLTKNIKSARGTMIE